MFYKSNLLNSKNSRSRIEILFDLVISETSYMYFWRQIQYSYLFWFDLKKDHLVLNRVGKILAQFSAITQKFGS